MLRPPCASRVYFYIGPASGSNPSDPLVRTVHIRWKMSTFFFLTKKKKKKHNGLNHRNASGLYISYQSYTPLVSSLVSSFSTRDAGNCASLQSLRMGFRPFLFANPRAQPPCAMVHHSHIQGNPKNKLSVSLPYHACLFPFFSLFSSLPAVFYLFFFLF